MAPVFDGFPHEGVGFLRELEKNNRRDWFLENKETFEDMVQAPMVELVEAVNSALAKFAPMYMNPADSAIPRMNRDVRFSKDKSPYKTNVSAVFPRQGKEKHQVAGYYFGVDANGVEIIAGSYMPDTPQLTAIRKVLAERHKEFRKVLAGKVLKDQFGDLQGEELQKVPKGFPPDHPAADLLRKKQFYVRTTLPGSTLTSPALLDEIVARFKAATPLVEFLDEALADS